MDDRHAGIPVGMLQVTGRISHRDAAAALQLPDEIEPEPQQDDVPDYGRRERFGNNKAHVPKAHKRKRASIAAASRRRNRQK